MNKGVQTKSLAEFEIVNFYKFDGKEEVGNDCDFFVIAGAGIINIGFAKGKPIVNAHPGIIPLTRGLDSFKWAIYNGDPLGITLHLIDKEVDKGEICFIKKTPIFCSDDLNSLARRHYETEINLLSKVTEIIDQRNNSCFSEKPAMKRMSFELERKMIEKFENWKIGKLEN